MKWKKINFVKQEDHFLRYYLLNAITKWATCTYQCGPLGASYKARFWRRSTHMPNLTEEVWLWSDTIATSDSEGAPVSNLRQPTTRQRAGLLSRLMDERRDVVFRERLKGMKSMRSIYSAWESARGFAGRWTRREYEVCPIAPGRWVGGARTAIEAGET